MKANEYYSMQQGYNRTLRIIIFGLFLLALAMYVGRMDKEEEQETRTINEHRTEGRMINEVDGLWIIKQN